MAENQSQQPGENDFEENNNEFAYANRLAQIRDNQSPDEARALSEAHKSLVGPSSFKYLLILFMLAIPNDMIDGLELTGILAILSWIISLFLSAITWLVMWFTDSELKRVKGHMANIEKYHKTAAKTATKVAAKLVKFAPKNPNVKIVAGAILEMIPYISLLPWSMISVLLAYWDERKTYKEAKRNSEEILTPDVIGGPEYIPSYAMAYNYPTMIEGYEGEPEPESAISQGFGGSIFSPKSIPGVAVPYSGIRSQYYPPNSILTPEEKSEKEIGSTIQRPAIAKLSPLPTPISPAAPTSNVLDLRNLSSKPLSTPTTTRPAKTEPESRIQIARNRLNTQHRELEDIGLHAMVAILADQGHIENQQINIIENPDKTSLRLNFKLTEQHYNTLKDKYRNYDQSSIVYGGGDKSYSLVDAWSKELDGAAIKLSTGKNGSGNTIRSSFGLVEISIPKSDGLTDDQINEKINQILVQELEIPTGLSIPTADEENAYKKARYMWHHKTDETPADIDSRLSREEVSQGYYTFVEKGKHKEYQQINPYAVYHQVYRVENLPQIVKAGGLLSTHERYRRGLTVEGMSSVSDIETGGADSVFTRIVTEDGFKNSSESVKSAKYNIAFVFEPDLLDRTDWYTYESDKYGSTDPETFKQRYSPKSLVASQKNTWSTGNEQMFRSGISLEKVKAITGATEHDVGLIIETLHDAGIKEINGKPIEQIVVIAPTAGDFVKISKGEQVEYSKPMAQIIEEQEKISKEGKENKALAMKEPFEAVIKFSQQSADLLETLPTFLQADSRSATSAIDVVLPTIDETIKAYEQIWPEYLSLKQKQEILTNFERIADLSHNLQKEELFSLVYGGQYNKDLSEGFKDFEGKFRDWARKIQKDLKNQTRDT